MIHYQLQCSQAHAFDGWFKDSATFDQQARRHLIECPECGDTGVARALMAPAVSKRQAPTVATPAALPPASVATPAMTAEKVAAVQMSMGALMRGRGQAAMLAPFVNRTRVNARRLRRKA